MVKTGADIYEFLAPTYQSICESRARYIAAVNQHCIELLSQSRNWLDVGSGDGARVRDIISQVRIENIVCIEPSRAMADLCAENVPEGEVYNRYLDVLFSNNHLNHFDCVTALWNVLGHVPSAGERRKFVDHVRTALRPGGIFLLDVNNRHNGQAYGFFRCLSRYLLDRFCFRESNGDATYTLTVNGKSERCQGHIFTAEELVDLFPRDKWASVEICYIHYRSGKRVNTRFQGQILVKAIAL